MNTHIIGEVDTLQLPGQDWTVFKTLRTWAWGGLDEKSVKSNPVAAACSPGNIRWKTVCQLVETVSFERGYLGNLNINQKKVWYGGWKTLQEISQDPDAVMSVVKGIFDESKTLTAVDFKSQLELEEVTV